MMIEPGLASRALDAAGDAIVTVDREGLITSWNPGAELLLGHFADQAVGQTLALIIPEEHRARHMAGFHAAMESDHLAQGGQPVRVEAMASNGQTVPIMMTLGLLPSIDSLTSAIESQAVGAVAVLRRSGPMSFV
jgi:PAS domain S-box-containing protein